MWNIEEERERAQHFALRAATLQDLGLDEAADLFLELVELCDRKIEIFNLLHKSAVALHEIKPPGQT